MDFDKNWYTKFFDQADLKKAVVSIHLCGYRAADSTSSDHARGPPTNHWLMFLEVPGGKSSRIDVTPGGADFETAVLMLDSKNYQYTSAAVKVLSIAPVAGTTVQTVCKLIQDKGRTRYKFSDGEGCRYWETVVAKDFVDAGLVKKGWDTDVVNTLKYYWKDANTKEAREIKPGTWY